MNDRDALYLRHILECIAVVKLASSRGVDLEGSPVERDAVLHNLQLIGESSKRLSADATASRPNVDWRRIVGLRNILVHEYLGVDLTIVHDVVALWLPELEAAVADMLRHPEP